MQQCSANCLQRKRAQISGVGMRQCVGAGVIRSSSSCCALHGHSLRRCVRSPTETRRPER
eukprot:8894308-Pyramimonas_sp.AAC.1